MSSILYFPVRGDLYGTCFWSGLRVMAGGSSRYVAAWLSRWKQNWTSASRPELLWITSRSMFSGSLFSLYLYTNTDACECVNIKEGYEHIHRHHSASHLSLVLPQSNGPNSKYPGLTAYVFRSTSTICGTLVLLAKRVLRKSIHGTSQSNGHHVSSNLLAIKENCKEIEDAC